MKLRIQGNSLRLRLTRSEVEILRDGGEVSDTISFRSGAALTYRLQRRTDAEEVQADLVHGSISVSVPGTMVERWVGSDDVGIYGEHGELRIAIEKDFRCLTRAAEEQDADAYPNPAGQCTA